MKKKTIIKIMTIALMAVMISTCLSNVVLAGDPMSMEIPTGSAGDTSAKFNDILNIVLGIVQVIGIAIAASMAMSLPISTPPNAIAHSTGLVKQNEMVKIGLTIGVIGMSLGYLMLYILGINHIL